MRDPFNATPPTAEEIEEAKKGGVSTYDHEIQSWLVKRKGDWIVSVTPMIYNDRVILTNVKDYPGGYSAGWCYDKDGSAFIAAVAWDPLEDREPVGYKKMAVDVRTS